MMRSLILALAVAGTAWPLAAAPFTVRVVDASGRPVRDAVVTLRPAGNAARAPRGGGRFVVSQKDLKFQPFLSIVPVGANVSFPNLDPTKHHVYSFSPAKKFELKLFARDQSRTVAFDRPGVVALGCNIHDQMTAFIVITDSQWTAKTDGRGLVTFADAPDQPARLTVWHPYLRAPGNSVAKSIPAGDRGESFTVALRPPPMPMPAY